MINYRTIMKTTKLAIALSALMTVTTLSSCLGDSETTGTSAWYGIVKVSGSYGSYVFYLADDTYIIPTNQSALSSSLSSYSYAYIVAYYDIEDLETSTTSISMEIYGISPIKTCSVYSGTDTMDAYSNIAIKSVTNNSSDGYISFFSAYDMFVPISYYYMDSDDIDTHDFRIFYDMDECEETIMTFHLRHYVEDESINSSRLTYGTEYVHFRISSPISYFLSQYGSVPQYIELDYPYNYSSADLDDATLITLSDDIEYGDIYDSF